MWIRWSRDSACHRSVSWLLHAQNEYKVNKLLAITIKLIVAIVEKNSLPSWFWHTFKDGLIQVNKHLLVREKATSFYCVTHKSFYFFVRFKPPRVSQDYLKSVVLEFKKHQTYEATFNKLVSGDWANSYYHTRDSRHQKLFKEHVFRFLRMFDKNSGFEIQPCYRYDFDVERQTLKQILL